MNYDLLCFSHLRWNFVYQRPQHLLSRFAGGHRVFFFEEPVFGEYEDRLEITQDKTNSNLWIVVPLLSAANTAATNIQVQRKMLNSLLASMKVSEFVTWYYSPMAMAWSDHLHPLIVVYDCMDELSAFKFAPTELIEYETKLFKRADLVFTGGHSLYEVKKHFHSSVYSFPSSIDKAHFAVARTGLTEPEDQQAIPHPRLGYYGVLDERLDISLLNELSDLRPEWHFIMLGPVVKIDPATLPNKNNIHYPGNKRYDELPAYLGGWDIALMPFALNASTKFISPTKTPEYLAGGKRVISTAIRDVVTPYGAEGLVDIAHTAPEFIAVAEIRLKQTGYNNWLSRVDAFLEDISWDKTWKSMDTLIKLSVANKLIVHSKSTKYV